MSQYRYTNLMEYLPVRYSATVEQQNSRQEIYNFKNGICSSHIKAGIVEKINALNITDKSAWRVCFIPASTNQKTRTRYSSLAEEIENKTGISCSYTAISDTHDRESGYKTGKKSNPAEDFTVDTHFVNAKNIILIDDIITRGNTFDSTARKLQAHGANEIVGIFVAKTINPDWHHRRGGADFDFFDPADMYDPADDFDPADMYDPADDFDPADMYDPADDFDPADMYDPADDFDPADMYEY